MHRPCVSSVCSSPRSAPHAWQLPALALALLLHFALGCQGGGSGGGGSSEEQIVQEERVDEVIADLGDDGDSGGGGGDPPPAPGVRRITLTWQPSVSPGVVRYLLSIGRQSGAYDTALVIPVTDAIRETDGTLSHEIDLLSETDHYLALRANDGHGVSRYSNEIRVPALPPVAALAASADGEPLVGAAFSRETSAAAGADDAAEGSADADAPIAKEGAAGLHFELASDSPGALDLSVVLPFGQEVDRTRAAAEDCVYTGLEPGVIPAVEGVHCAAPALGPYLVFASNPSGAPLPAELRVRGADGALRARFERIVPAGGEVFALYEHALEPAGCAVVSVGRAPLDRLDGTYLGFEGGLHPEGRNETPAPHAAEGRARASRITPLDPSGQPGPNGVIAMLAIGAEPVAGSFDALAELASREAALAEAVVLVNGAAEAGSAAAWDDPDRPAYDRVRDEALAPAGLSEAQVQVVWLVPSPARFRVGLPHADADVFALLAQLGDTVRALRARYPNLQQVLLSGRSYAGYARDAREREPAAYETAFPPKWLIEAQLRQGAGDGIDPLAGDLDPDATPWLGWGPSLWADGLSPASDGLVWACDDFAADGVALSSAGEAKAGRRLLDFLRDSPFTTPWSAPR